jgi:hypothetical protein
MGEEISRLLGDSSKRKKEQKTALMLLDELDNNQQRNSIVAAVVAHAFSRSGNHIIIRHQGNHMDAHYEVIVDKIVKLKENMPILFTQMYCLSLSSFDNCFQLLSLAYNQERKVEKNVLPTIKLCLGLYICMLEGHSLTS